MRKLNAKTTQPRKLELRSDTIAKLELDREKLVHAHGAIGSGASCVPTSVNC